MVYTYYHDTAAVHTSCIYIRAPTTAITPNLVGKQSSIRGHVLLCLLATAACMYVTVLCVYVQARNTSHIQEESPERLIRSSREKERVFIAFASGGVFAHNSPTNEPAAMAKASPLSFVYGPSRVKVVRGREVSVGSQPS